MMFQIDSNVSAYRIRNSIHRCFEGCENRYWHCLVFCDLKSSAELCERPAVRWLVLRLLSRLPDHVKVKKESDCHSVTVEVHTEEVGQRMDLFILENYKSIILSEK